MCILGYLLVTRQVTILYNLTEISTIDKHAAVITVLCDYTADCQVLADLVGVTEVTKARSMVLGGLLTGLSILIPVAFRGWLQVFIPPFSATLGSHVPGMLAMFISPGIAAMVSIGSVIGFLITTGPVIAARAAIHIAWAIVGAVLYQRGVKPWLVLLAITPIHALGEALVVLPFGFDLAAAGISVGIGTALHHLVDSLIAVFLFGALTRAGIRLSERS